MPKPAFSDGFDSIDAVLQSAVEAGDVLGVVAMACTSDGVAYAGSTGTANVETGAAMTPDSVFWLLSMTKTFTAVACMQLIEQGRLDPEQQAGDILPRLESPQVLEGFDPDGAPCLRPAKRPITVRHLLTHTSGFTYASWSEAQSRYASVTGLPGMGTAQNKAFEAPLEFDPGDRWEYGIGMDWIGKLVEQVSNQSLEVYFRENIFEPLGMKDCGFLIGSEQRSRVPTLAVRQADGSLQPEPFEMPQRPEFFIGGGGAFGTPRDYIRLLQALLNGGVLDGVRILRPETVESMRTNQIGDLNVHEMRTVAPRITNSFDQFPDHRHKWGYSFDINTQPGPHGRAAGSISWGGLLNCYFWIDPAKDVAGALFTQLRPFFDDRVIALYNAFESRLYQALARA
jgi:methyl acetate hydrolase